MAQFSMEDIARIGLLKMDFLGLINLTILDRAVEIIRDNRNIDIDRHRLPMDDAKTFNLLSSGETMGVFQLEGSGMRRHIKDLKPTSSWETLTKRERQVLKLIAEGQKNKEIADYLCVSVKTVEKHRANLMEKLDLHSAAALTAFAMERGLTAK